MKQLAWRFAELAVPPLAIAAGAVAFAVAVALTVPVVAFAEFLCRLED